jgi:6-pyruvoyltetrahydropterin/6-carboxytetrahydropterin synthase
VIVTVKHNFETAHRLPCLPGKCQSLHGHSWWVEWLFDAPMDENGITLEYGALKKQLRTWVDRYLDHGTMLGHEDNLIEFAPMLGKVFIFGPGGGYPFKPWPTVEAVAEMLGYQASILAGICPIEVRVQETHVNAAIWRAGITNESE